MTTPSTGPEAMGGSGPGSKGPGILIVFGGDGMNWSVGDVGKLCRGREAS